MIICCPVVGNDQSPTRRRSLYKIESEGVVEAILSAAGLDFCRFSNNKLSFDVFLNYILFSWEWIIKFSKKGPDVTLILICLSSANPP